MEKPRDEKGRLKGGGRKKGVPNKVNGQVREMILGALSDVGGQKYLAQQAMANPVAFMSLLGRILPMQHTGDGGGPVQIEVVTGIPRAPGDE